jgi:hypothetical protein
MSEERAKYETVRDYFGVPAMSASAIKRGAVSMKAMEAYTQAGGMEQTPAMRLGTLCHMAILEPRQFAFIQPVTSRRCKAVQELVAAGMPVYDEAEVETAVRVAEAVAAHPVAASYTRALVATESEHYWETEGHACKAKLDGMLRLHQFVEVKTCASLSRFISDAARMYYHLQLGWYGHALRQARSTDAMPDAIVVAVETKAPYDVAVFRARPRQLKMWYAEALDIARRYWSGDRAGAYPDEMELELPSWAEHAGNGDALDFEDYGL